MYMLKPTPQRDDIRSWGLGRWVSLKGRVLINGISTLMQDAHESSPVLSSKWGHREMAIYEPAMELGKVCRLGFNTYVVWDTHTLHIKVDSWADSWIYKPEVQGANQRSKHKLELVSLLITYKIVRLDEVANEMDFD